MTIAGEGKNPTLDHILSVGKEFDFKDSEIAAMIGSISNSVDRWPIFAKEAGIPDSVTARISKSFLRFPSRTHPRLQRR